MSRLLRFLAWALFALVNGFGFSVFAWAAAHLDWPLLFWMIAASCLLAMLCGVWAMLDELLPVNDPRRIYRRHN